MLTSQKPRSLSQAYFKISSSTYFIGKSLNFAREIKKINTPDCIISFAVKNIVLVIYQTREAVFHQDIQSPRKELKIPRRAAEYF